MSKRFSEARIKRIAKEVADLWDNHCECPSKNFNREALLEQVITNALLDERPAPAGEPQRPGNPNPCELHGIPHCPFPACEPQPQAPEETE